MPDKFCFETYFLKTKTADLKIGVKIFAGDFIDIGIPEDYEKAQINIPNWTHSSNNKMTHQVRNDGA